MRHRNPKPIAWLIIGAALIALGACEDKVEEVQAMAAEIPSAVDALEFIERAEFDLEEQSEIGKRQYWVQSTFITSDTNWLSSRSWEKNLSMRTDFANEANQFIDVDLPEGLARKMEFLKRGSSFPAPRNAGKTRELAEIGTWLDATYGTAKYCPAEGPCLSDREIIRTMATSRDPEELLDVWAGWRTISPPMRGKYTRMVEIANEGVRELGYRDLSVQWQSKYDMPAEDFVQVAEGLWQQVKPLYENLQCHVRARLEDHYGDELLPGDGTIPAHLLGNPWAQQWGNIYDIVADGETDIGYDLTDLLIEKGYDEVAIVKSAEGFFTSLGFDPLPDTFWTRSLITKPQDRSVQCHASAWGLGQDVRIKMCTEVTAEDFETVHHELGHVFYGRAAFGQDYLFRGGAHDGFHEAIGDMIALSITPSYLVSLGLLEDEPDASKDIGLLLNSAMDKVAFLPFGLLMDKWRWGVFSGEIAPEDYNAAWWELRRKYQGVTPPMERGEEFFDPGAKMHIPGNTPYMRYFLAHILEYQFYQSACEQAGFEGPLHRCSFYGNKDVGERFNAMLEMGSSKPWPDALEAFTGTREMDASALLEYFAPLNTWLEEQNETRECGW